MKKLFLPMLAITFFVACKKDKTTGTPTPTPTAKDGFVWKEDGGAEITADSAFWTTWSSGTGIRAYKNGMANFFEINWDGANNTAPTTYTLAAPGGFTFLKGSATYTIASKQIITISAFSGDKLSGNFEVAVSGVSIKKVNGVFTNLTKR